MPNISAAGKDAETVTARLGEVADSSISSTSSILSHAVSLYAPWYLGIPLLRSAQKPGGAGTPRQCKS